MLEQRAFSSKKKLITLFWPWTVSFSDSRNVLAFWCPATRPSSKHAWSALSPATLIRHSTIPSLIRLDSTSVSLFHHSQIVGIDNYSPLSRQTPSQCTPNQHCSSCSLPPLRLVSTESERTAPTQSTVLQHRDLPLLLLPRRHLDLVTQRLRLRLFLFRGLSLEILA